MRRVTVRMLATRELNAESGYEIRGVVSRKLPDRDDFERGLNRPQTEFRHC